MDSFGDRIKIALKTSGVSQKTLAQRIGVSTTSVSGWVSGGKTPRQKRVEEIAAALGTSAGWLMFGEGKDPRAMAEREKQQNVLANAQWWFRPVPLDGGREYGDAAAIAFRGGLETLARETGQNSGDERLDTSPTVDFEFDVIELSGDMLSDFLSSLKFDALREHLLPAAEGDSRKARSIRVGFDALDGDGLLRLFRISDYGASGLTGNEFEKGRFTAVARNVLDSFKGHRGASAGGSWGAGKSSMWQCSLFGTTLMSSRLSVPEKEGGFRVFGRSELPFHEIASDGFAGPGWFGQKTSGTTTSLWSIDQVAEALLLDRGSDAPGASFLIVGGFDPSGKARTSEEMFNEVADGISDNFWPALAQPSGGAQPMMRATVRQYRNDELMAEQLVDPQARHKDRVRALQRHWANDVDDSLENPGDVVRRPVTLNIPPQVDGNGEAIEHEATLLVVFSSDEETQRGRVSLMRGPHMITRTLQVQALPVGAPRFSAVLLAGQSSGDRAEDRAAETLLRAAEPPAHNTWISTEEVAQSYARGARQSLIDFHGEIKKTVREILRPQSDATSDGPNSLKALLRLTGPTTVASAPQVRVAEGHVEQDGSWVLDEVEVSLPKRNDDQGWLLVPVVRFAVETGAGLPVKALGLREIEGCSVEDGVIRTAPGASRAKFSLYTDVGTHPVSSSRSKLDVDVRKYREKAHG